MGGTQILPNHGRGASRFCQSLVLINKMLMLYVCSDEVQVKSNTFKALYLEYLLVQNIINNNVVFYCTKVIIVDII